MIPVLYEKNSTTFTTQGLGPLPDTIECTVREERNGQYELEMRYPVTGLHYKDIEVGKIIRVRNAYCGLQPFDIYAISRPMNGVVTINAKHASYRLNKMVLRPCSGTTAASAMVAIGSHITYGPEAFTFWTDKTTQADWSTLVPVSVRAALGGTEGSVLDVYGGEFEWDNFDVKLHGSRGTDTGVTIKYGKNLLDIVAEENVAERFTACVPFYKARDDSVTIGSVVKTAEWNVIDNYIAPMDLTQYYEPPEGAADNWHPTTAQIEEKALALMTANAVSRIAQNLTVKFALLSQSAEYANLAALERVKLCDTVTVQHPGLGVDVKLKVIATTWNVLLDRYDDIELGQPKATLSQTIIGDLAKTFATLEEELADKVDWTHMDEAIENATDLLTGGTGGYVVIGRNAAGQPNEIFIMDQPDTTQAVSVIRLNKNGIGFSTQGINGPYTNAWTIDGHLVADFMDTGTLSATIIKAGVLSDPNGNFILDLPTGATTIKKGTITLGDKVNTNYYFAADTNGKFEWKGTKSSLDSNGVLSATDAVLSGSLVTKSGLYENRVEDGYVYYYHNDEYIGKVGTSLFDVVRNNQTVSAKGMMMDIGYDAELGGIAIQDNSSTPASLAFYYERDNDMFHFDKDVQINGEDVATQTWVTSQGYLTNSSLSGYATQSWVTDTALTNYATMDWVDDWYVTLTEFQQTAAVAKTLSALTDYSSDPSYTVGDLNHLKWSGRTGYSTTGNGPTVNLHWIVPKRFKYENSVQVPDWSGGYLSYYIDVKNGIITRYIERDSTDSTYKYELPGS